MRAGARSRWVRRGVAGIVGCGLIGVVALGSEPPTGASADVATARERAVLLHRVYAATLDTIHHHYFRRDQAVLPARAMEEIFATLEEQSGVKARWIAVNTRPMSLDHAPKTDFEHQAVTALVGGKDAFEQVDGTLYRRAGVIPLKSGCLSCHAGFGAPEPKSPRFAGLVITIPLNAPRPK